MSVNYCRREVTKDGKPRICMNAIKTANALDWCDECRERLPLWPREEGKKK